jgi:hypothetical protein
VKLADIIDFEQYPIHAVGSFGYEDLVRDCRASIAEKGAVRLAEFVSVPAIKAMVAEAVDLEDKAHQQDDLFTAYIGDEEPIGLPPDHPRRLPQRTAQAAVPWDVIPQSAVLRTFYEADFLTDFVAAVLEIDRLYRSADPLAACNLAFIKAGNELGWHFDSSEFSVTLQIQAPEDGGVFEFVPNTRTENDQKYDDVRDVLLGNENGVRRSLCEPGVLSIFKGHNSLHRVTPVVGPRPRITAVLTYADIPDFTVSEYSRQLFYGRLT